MVVTLSSKVTVNILQSCSIPIKLVTTLLSLMIYKLQVQHRMKNFKKCQHILCPEGPSSNIILSVIKRSQFHPVTSLFIESSSYSLTNHNKNQTWEFTVWKWAAGTNLLYAKYLDDTSGMTQIFLHEKCSWKWREATLGKQSLSLPAAASNYNTQTRSAEIPHDPEMDRSHKDIGWDTRCQLF